MGSVRQDPSQLFTVISDVHFQYTSRLYSNVSCPRRSTRGDHEHAMAGMNGTRVSVVIFVTSFLLGAFRNPHSACCEYRPHACSHSRAVVHALDRGLFDSVETAGNRRTAMDVCDILLCDRQSTDRIPLFFRLRGCWRRSHDTLVSPRRRGWEPHVRRGKHLFVLSCLIPPFLSLIL